MDKLLAVLKSSVTIAGIETTVGVVAVTVMFGLSIISLLVTILNTKKKALDPERWQPFQLSEVEKISHDVRRFRFALPGKDHVLGLPVGQHISLKYTDAEGKDVQRSYTPVTSDDEKGYVDFVIKVYYKNSHPRFPEGGKMSQHLDSLKIGDSILMKGPKGHLDYQGRGTFTIKHKGEITTYHKKKLGMVAGGTGITPMLAIIRAILKDPKDTTELWLLFGNQTEEDILLRKELESIPSSRLHLYYTLDRPPKGWKQGVGFVTEDMCRRYLPPAGEDTMIFMCGPPLMMDSIQAHLKNLGMKEGAFFKF